VLNEGLTVKKSFDIAPPNLRSKIIESYQRFNMKLSPTYGGGLKLATMTHKKLADNLGSTEANHLENELYFQGKRDEFAEALNDTCGKNVFNELMDLSDKKQVRKAAQLLK